MLLSRRFTLAATAAATLVGLTGCGSSAHSGSAQHQPPVHGAAAASVLTPAQPQDPAAERRWRQLSDSIGDVLPADENAVAIDLVSLGVAASRSRPLAIRVGAVKPVASGTIEIRLPTTAGIARAHITITAGTASAKLTTAGHSVPGKLTRQGTWTTATFPVHAQLTARPSAIATHGRSRDQVPNAPSSRDGHSHATSRAPDPPSPTPTAAGW